MERLLEKKVGSCPMMQNPKDHATESAHAKRNGTSITRETVLGYRFFMSKITNREIASSIVSGFLLYIFLA